MASYSTLDHTPTAFNISGLSKEDAYNKIALEISRLEGHIRSLYSVRNTLAPISSLPTELLSKVFMHCCDLNESGAFTDLRSDEDEDEDEEDPVDTRLVVSWVSRQWRNVALRYRPLWNLVINTKDEIHLDYVCACMERGQNLYIDAYTPEPEFFQLCASCISQTYYLKLVGDGSGREVEGSILPERAQLLRSLVLGPGVSAAVLNDFTAGQCPRLRSLELYSHRFDWSIVTHVASTLTNLTVTDPYNKVTTIEFIRLLETLQLLTWCRIINCLRVVDDGPSNRIQLPRLQKVIISDSVAAIIQLLHNISTPIASIRSISSDRTDDLDIQALVHVLQTNQEHVWNSVHHLRCHYFTLTVSSSLSFAGHSICYLSTKFPRDRLLLACRYLNLDKLESVWINDASAKSMGKLSQLAHLQTVSLETSLPIEAFISYMETCIKKQQSTTPFPALQELCLVRLGRGDLIGGLYTVLTARKIAGVPLGKLIFVDCQGIEISAIAQLQKVVDNVVIKEECVGDFIPYQA